MMPIAFYMKSISILGGLVLCTVGCQFTKSENKLDGPHNAALRIQSKIAVGVTPVELHASLSDLAYELLLLKDSKLGTKQKEALSKYSNVLTTYMKSLELLEAKNEVEPCYQGRDYDNCLNNLAQRVGLTRAEFLRANVLPKMWETAEREVKDAYSLSK